MITQRVVITEYDKNHSALKEAIDTGLELAKDSRLVILTGVKDSLALDQSLGRSTINHINKTHSYRGVRIYIESLKTYKSPKLNDVVVVVYLSDLEADHIDSITGVSYILAVENHKGELEKWMLRWNISYDGNGQSSLPKTDLPCILKVALDKLSNQINIGDGLAHSSDDNFAKTYIRTFFKYGIVLNTTSIKNYLITIHHWKPEYANQFILWINKMKNGGHFKGGDKTGLSRYYKLWKAECDNYQDE